MSGFLKSITILTLLFVAACGPKPASSPVAPGGNLVSFNHPANVAFRGGEVYCEGVCPEFVAALYMYYGVVDHGSYKSHKIKTCSATLIAEDKIVTNYHCIENIITAGGECNKQSVTMQIKFPTADPAKPEVYHCKKVERVSGSLKETKMHPDWAIIQLHKKVVGRKPVTEHQDDVDSGQVAHLYPVYYDKNWRNPVGVIRPTTCTFKIGDTHNIFAFGDDAPLFGLENCSRKIIPGNSGTGVFAKLSSGLIGTLSHAGSGDMTQARGTRSACFRTGPTEETDPSCYFPTEALEANFIATAKRMSFIRGVIGRPEMLSLNFIEARKSMVAYGLLEDLFPRRQRRSREAAEMTLTLDDENKQILNYLTSKEVKLARRYRHLLRRLHMPLRAHCVYPDQLNDNNLYPLLTLNWQSAALDWSEEVREDGSLIMAQLWSNIEPRLMMVELDVVSKTADVVHLKSKSGTALPQGLSGFEMKLPVCLDF